MHNYHNLEPPAYHGGADGAPPLLFADNPIPQRVRQRVGKHKLRQREIQPVLADVQTLLLLPPSNTSGRKY
jgi:hypothetical protein